jgi:3-oxo-5alpha-steroid 4-dehydrogenase
MPIAYEVWQTKGLTMSAQRNASHHLGRAERLSRRRFLGTASAGVVAGAIAGAGTISRFADVAAAQPPATWDQEADVIIAGGGGAGLSAAIEAARAGAEVLVFEQSDQLGGNTAHSGGVFYLGGGTPLQLQHGFEDTVDNMSTYLVAQMGPTADVERIQIYCEESVEHYNWLESIGVPFGTEYWPGKVVQPSAEDGGLSFSGNEANYPFDSIAEPMPRGHMAIGAGAAVGMALLETAEAEPGITTVLESHVDRLVTDADGRVVGVVVKVAGEEQFVLARKGVVLTTGGFQFNPEMVNIHLPWYNDAFPLGGPQMGDDGSGIRMAQAVGADVTNMSFASPWKFVYAPGEMCKSILVNGQGSRFVNEAAYGQDIGEGIVLENDGVCWMIMDQALVDELAEIGRSLSDPTATADTLDDLAVQLELSQPVFAQTLAFYNEQAALGDDPVFHKKAEFLQPLETAPYYAFNFGMATGMPYITLGGLRADAQTRVLNALDYSPIPGLFSAGRTAPGISNEFYNSGTAIGDCTFWGRVAGREVAAAEPWSGEDGA